MQTYPHCYSSVPALFSHLKLYEGTVQQSDVTCERCNVSIVAAQFISVYLDHYGKVPLVAELNCCYIITNDV